MASSDSGSSSESEYQVFLNFRGLDTGAGFTDFLYHSLTDVGICVFRDDEQHRVGEDIAGLVERAIVKSRIYIPIFSQTYASSQWCLCELKQIVANWSESKGTKLIFPIFFDVELECDDVELRTPKYHDAILNLKNEKQLSDEDVEAWKNALREVCRNKGWEVQKDARQGKLIYSIVEEVVEKLRTKYRLVSEHLVGIDDQVLAVKNLLDINSGGVRFVTIYGMGGVGKTTLATIIFNQLSPHFRESCFLEDVTENSRVHGLIELQRKIIAEICSSKFAEHFLSVDEGVNTIQKVACEKKVLLILDDVDDSEQVRKLSGHGRLGSGSRILITTRIKDVWPIDESYQVLDYEMEMISTEHALELFKWHALNEDSTSDDYTNLSRDIVATTGRLPLALEAIGSSLYNKNLQQWKQTLNGLREAPHVDVFRKLQISYDALDYKEKVIFLDIACFFIGENMTNAMYMWDECGLSPYIGVEVLCGMCWIKILENNKFWMHDQVRDVGRKIARQESEGNPGRRSRLWTCNEVLDATRTKEMKNNVCALHLDTYPRSSHDVVVQSKEIERFENLRFLKLTGGTFVGDTVDGLAELRWISWNRPLRLYEWTDMCLENVVILEFSDVDVLDDSRLQNSIERTKKLKVLSLESCHNLSRTPNFSGCPRLERLTIQRCSSLREIDESIGELKCLIDLKISECSNLEHLPEEIGALLNLEHLFVGLHKVTKLPSSIWELKLLREVHFDGAIDVSGLATMWELPSTIGLLKKLKVLIVRNYYLEGQLPFQIGGLPRLETLILSHTSVSEVPETISMHPRLQRLELINCSRIQELPDLPTSLTHLRVSSTPLRIVPDLSNLTNLVELDLDDIGGQGGDKSCTHGLWRIGRLGKLTKLSLKLQNAPAPPELASLSLLSQLDLFGLDLQTLPQLPSSLQKLGLDDFNSILSLSLNLRNLSCLKVSGSPVQEIQLDGLQLPHIRELLVDRCVLLKGLKLSRMRKLKDVHVRRCKKLFEIQFPRVLESLEALCIDSCRSLGRLVYEGEAEHDNTESARDLVSSEGNLILPCSTLIKLQSFTLINCPKILEIEVVGMSESWEHFNLRECPYVQSLGDLSNLKYLKSFHMYRNNQLLVVKGLDELKFLDSLQVRECRSLERLIDVSSTKLPNHCYIHISGSRKEFRGSLESYKHPKEHERDLEKEQERELERDLEQEQARDFEHGQESDFEQESEKESDFAQEEETKPRRRLGRVSILLKIGVATCLLALLLPKALHMNKKKIKASG